MKYYRDKVSETDFKNLKNTILMIRDLNDQQRDILIDAFNKKYFKAISKARNLSITLFISIIAFYILKASNFQQLTVGLIKIESDDASYLLRFLPIFITWSFFSLVMNFDNHMTNSIIIKELHRVRLFNGNNISLLLRAYNINDYLFNNENIDNEKNNDFKELKFDKFSIFRLILQISIGIPFLIIIVSLILIFIFLLYTLHDIISYSGEKYSDLLQNFLSILSYSFLIATAGYFINHLIKVFTIKKHLSEI